MRTARRDPVPERKITMHEYRPAGRFNDRPGPKYQAAVAALTELVATEGVQEAVRASAHALSNPLYDAWLRATGCRPAQRPCIQRLLGRPCRIARAPYWECHCHPPADDHPILFLK